MKESGEGTLTGVGTGRIVWRYWEPQDAPLAVVVIAHGFGEHSGRYAQVAQRLTGEGHAVYALDHHGHGRSDGPRGRVSVDDAAEDLDRLSVVAAGRHPAHPLFLLGHSMGGAVALRCAMRHQDRLAGLILTSPLAQVDGHAAAKALSRVIAAVAPGLPLAKLDPKLISRDPAVVQAYIDDPLVLHRPIPAGTVAQFIALVNALPGEVGAIKLPVLLAYGTADRLCAPAGSVMISQRIGSSDLTTTPYEGLYHEILNEPEQRQVLDQICGWLEARSAAPPGRSAGTAG
ncbi:MAG: lysophospholipase [Solirubrobacteraceae bacterium]